MVEINLFFLTNKTKKINKIKKNIFRLHAGKISNQPENEYYENGENAQIRKIVNNFHFSFHILAKIIKNFLDFNVFPHFCNIHHLVGH